MDWSENPFASVLLFYHIFYFQEFIDELKLYIVLYDRAGYGESDPYPARSVKSEAFDIQELADKLYLGTKFYVIGCSMGASSVWSCLKYIPDRHFFISLWSVPTFLDIFRLSLTLNGTLFADF